mmetsp:Transcript_132802/g.283740  ORF Transcript_132802/g.283740 Transcript_132802/m.283740 type:complete len:384 (-) Transcript_132802:11-1162(-)
MPMPKPKMESPMGFTQMDSSMGAMPMPKPKAPLQAAPAPEVSAMPSAKAPMQAAPEPSESAPPSFAMAKPKAEPPATGRRRQRHGWDEDGAGAEPPAASGSWDAPKAAPDTDAPKAAQFPFSNMPGAGQMAPPGMGAMPKPGMVAPPMPKPGMGGAMPKPGMNVAPPQGQGMGAMPMPKPGMGGAMPMPKPQAQGGQPQIVPAKMLGSTPGLGGAAPFGAMAKPKGQVVAPPPMGAMAKPKGPPPPTSKQWDPATGTYIEEELPAEVQAMMANSASTPQATPQTAPQEAPQAAPQAPPVAPSNGKSDASHGESLCQQGKTLAADGKLVDAFKMYSQGLKILMAVVPDDSSQPTEEEQAQKRNVMRYMDEMEGVQKALRASRAS